jgi:hypothetical protein
MNTLQSVLRVLLQPVLPFTHKQQTTPTGLILADSQLHSKSPRIIPPRINPHSFKPQQLQQTTATHAN